MKQFSKLILIILGSSALILGLSMFSSEKAEGGSGSAPVTVTNTPLPVNVENTAHVSISSSSTVPVSVQGTPNVNIANSTTLPVSVSSMPDVTIGNSSLPVTLTGPVNLSSGTSVLVGNTTDGSGNPVPLVTQNAAGPASSAVQVEICDEAGTSSSCGSMTANGSAITVDSGKRLVIQFVSGECVATAGAFATVELQTSLNGGDLDHEILLHPTSSSNILEMSQRVRLYADPGTKVHLYDSTDPGTNGYCNLVISGYTVPYTAAP